MNLSSLQAAIVAAVVQVASLVASFGVINSTEVGIITSCTTALVAAAFQVAVAIENHGKAGASATPTVVVNPPAAAPAAKSAK